MDRDLRQRANLREPTSSKVTLITVIIFGFAIAMVIGLAIENLSMGDAQPELPPATSDSLK